MSAYGLIDGVVIRNSNATYLVSGRATNINFLCGSVPTGTGGCHNVPVRCGTANEMVQPKVSNGVIEKDTTQKLSEIRKAAAALNETMNTFDKKNNEAGALDKPTSAPVVSDDTQASVERFVENYNSMLDSMEDVASQSVNREAGKLADITKANKAELNKIGIHVGQDGSLQLEEESFRNADEDSIKNVFHKRGAYGKQVDAQVSMVAYAVKRELSKTNMYNRTGGYGHNYNYSHECYI